MSGVKVNIDLSGLTQLGKDLERAEDKVPELAAQETVKLAKKDVPVRTGVLRDSIAYGRVQRGVWMAIAAIHYAGYVEYGTRKMAAQPYMIPALEALDWDRIFKSVIHD